MNRWPLHFWDTDSSLAEKMSDEYLCVLIDQTDFGGIAGYGLLVEVMKRFHRKADDRTGTTDEELAEFIRRQR